MLAAASQADSARTGHSSVLAVGQGDGDRGGLGSLAAGQGEPEAAVGALEVGHPDAGKLGAAQSAGEPHQQQRPVAEAGQAAGRARVDRNGRQELAQHGQGRRALLDGVGRVAADAGQGFGHMGVLGRRGAAGGPVQEADGGTAQVEGVGGEAAVALLGQEGRHVERRGRQGDEAMGGAPGAPGAHGGAVGAAGVVGLGAAAVGARGLLCGCQAAVGFRLEGLGCRVEPQANGLRRSAEGHGASVGRLAPSTAGSAEEDSRAALSWSTDSSGPS